MTQAASPSPAQAIEISPEQGEIGRALAWLETQAEAAQLPMRAMFALNLGLDETLANIVMHGFREPANGAPVIHIECSSDEEGFDLTVRDNGVPFDPTAQASAELAASLEEATLGGHGLRLMRHFLHDLHYERTQGWNVLRMRMLRKEAPESD
ncbi:MAG: ATP-binding protein [Burkholderiaceae bacterium]